jgi:phage regulator Rha-like protein
MMSGLTLVHNQAVFTNTLIVAEGTGLEHASIIKLVRKYKSGFEEFESHQDLTYQQRKIKIAEHFALRLAVTPLAAIA